MFRNPNYVYGDDSLLKVPTHLNFAKYMLQKIWPYKDVVALINGHTQEKLTYRELAQNAINIAISIHRMGVKKGDTISICSENRQEYISTVIGVMCAGAAVTCVNPAYTEGELKYLLGISKPKMLFCSPIAYETHERTLKTLPYLRKIILFGDGKRNDALFYRDLVKPVDDLDKDGVDLHNSFDAVEVMGQTDTAVILYSSGTTGLPKGVMLTHLNLIATCELPDTLDPKEMSMHISPWYHVMGLMGTMRFCCSGGTFVYLAKFEVDLYMKIIATYKIVQLIVAPPVLTAVCKSKNTYDLSSVKVVYSGAAPLRDDTIADVKKRIPNLIAVLQGYGMTEATLAVLRDTYLDAHRTKAGGVGRVVPGTTVKIVDVETRRVLGPNQAGEICLKGPTIMKGYVGKNRKEDFDEEDFYKTGDIGYYDNDQYFFIVDRLKELIKYKGYQVAPAELEAVLLQHPGIKDAGVVGIRHESGEELPRAFIVLQPGCELSEDKIKAFVAQKVSNPKHIRGGVRFVSDIPKNPSGKIMRRLLRDMAKKQSKL